MRPLDRVAPSRVEQGLSAIRRKSSITPNFRTLFFLAISFVGMLSAEASPLEPELLGDESYHESVTIVADLDDGTYVFLQFGYSNLGSGDGHGVCRAQIIEKGKEPWIDVAKYKREEWAYSNKPVPQINLGACRLWQGQYLEVHVPINESVVRLTVRARVRAVSPPGSKIKAGDDFYNYSVLVGMAPVRAEWSINGAPGKSSEGYGYVDKLRSTAMPAEVADYWIRFRALQDKGILVVGRVPADGGTADLWYWRPGIDAKPTPGVSLSLGGVDKGAQAYSIKLDLGAAGRLELDSGQEIFRYAPVEKFGWLGIFAKAVVGNPVTRTFRPVVQTPVGAYPKSLLEISYVK